MSKGKSRRLKKEKKEDEIIDNLYADIKADPKKRKTLNVCSAITESSPESNRIFWELFDNELSGKDRYSLINQLARELNKRRLLTDDEAKEIAEISELFLEGKTRLEVLQHVAAKGSRAMGKLAFRLAAGFVVVDVARAQLEFHRPIDLFLNNIKKLTPSDIDAVFTTIIEHMRLNNAISQQEAEEAFRTVYHMSTVSNHKQTYAFKKVLKLISEDYVYVMKIDDGLVFHFRDNDNYDAFEDRLKDVGMI
jgi:hypothetical protein